MKKIISMFIFVFLVFASSGVSAAESLPVKQGIATDKVWTVKFNMPIDTSGVNSAVIYVMDNQYYMQDTKLTFSEDKTTVYIAPKANYKTDTEYVIVVESSIKSTSGASMKHNFYYKFRTVN